MHMSLKLLRERVRNNCGGFRLVLSSGQRLTISRPDPIMVGRRKAFILGKNEELIEIHRRTINAIENLQSWKRR